MAWNTDGNIDAEEIGSVLKLMPTTSGSMDLELSIQIDGTFIQGESKSSHGNGDVLSVFGYYFKSQISLDLKRNLKPGPFWVVRDLDAATASLSSAMKALSGDTTKMMIVELRAFKAGGMKTAGEVSRPVLNFKLDQAIIAFQGFHTSSPSGIPSEVLGFNYRSITIETTPQLESGLMGATRNCQFTRSK
jgi:type VI protein secretion system component Hcp